MSKRLPYLLIQGPDGQEDKVFLTKERMTIGRFAEFNDIALEPDPQQLISRQAHCALERASGGWWIVDNGSINRTFVQQEDVMRVVSGRAIITSGDVVCILGRLTDTGEPIYWKLLFEDPWSTQALPPIHQLTYLRYDWVQAKLFRVVGLSKEEIPSLSPQEHKLIRYMDQRNRANGNVPVMCTYDELIVAVWGDEVGHTETEVNHLVWRLRKKIELNSKEPQFLQTVSGLGYRLETQPAPDQA